MKRNQFFWLIILGCLVFVFGAIWYFDLGRFVSLEYLQAQSSFLTQWTAGNYFLAVILYLTVFTAIIGLSIPATGPLTLLGGFLFGTLRGSVFAVAGATLGASIGFLVLRRGVSDTLKEKYGKHLQNFEKNIKSYGPFYLLILHFSTMVPYGVINVLAALANVRLRTIAWTTAVGFIPLAIVYTFAGSRLTEISSLGDLFSPGVVFALALLILLTLIPIVVKKIREGGRP